MTTSTAQNGAPTFDLALGYLESGLSTIPIRADGSKAAAIKWEPYQERKPTPAELQQWFRSGCQRGLAIVYGPVSGNAECIDLDNADLLAPFKAECERVAPGLLDRLTIVRTPRPGYHVIYRCEAIEGNQKLAFTVRPGEKPKVIIETRGAGGYALAPGCPLTCNPNNDGRLYEHVSGPPLTALPLITPADRAILFRVARSFNELVEDDPPSQTNGHQPTGLSPGDDYNKRATWEEILEPHGWHKTHSRGSVAYWRRPGKDDAGWSATSGNVSKHGNEVFCCFTDNAHPFQGANGSRPCSSYTKFAAFALLNHDGDYSAAASALSRGGYGEKTARRGMPDLRPAEYRDNGRERPTTPEPKVEYTRITSAELATGKYDVEYLITNAMVAGQPLIIAGPQKALKTSFLIDAAVSLENAGFFLGKFKVNRSCRVAVMTGESGLAVIQETAKRICEAANCDLSERAGLIWSPDIPKLNSQDHIEALEQFLQADEIEVLFVDPAYLAMPSADAGNLMAQGELLRNIGDLCQRMGVTLVLAHHTRKNTGQDPYEPLELHHIAWAGFPEFARQWWLVNRREKYEPGTGDHKLWLSIGGSAGHSGLWAIDVSEGTIEDSGGRRWEVDVNRADDARSAARKRQDDAKSAEEQKRFDEDRNSVCRLLAKYPDGLSKTKIAELAVVSRRRWPAVFAAMFESGELVEAEITVSNHRNSITGYKLGISDGNE